MKGESICRIKLGVNILADEPRYAKILTYMRQQKKKLNRRHLFDEN